MLGWRDGDKKHLWDIAKEEDVSDLVIEEPRRVSYRRSLDLLHGAAGALVLGVEDAAYIPSKMFTYLVSGKPVLAVVRRGGEASERLRSSGDQAHVIEFGTEGCDDAASALVLGRYLGHLRHGSNNATAERALSGYESAESAARHAELFERATTMADVEHR
jgi:hypothetical protein